MSKSNLIDHHPYVAKMRRWRTPIFNFGLVCSLSFVTFAFNWTSYNQEAMPMDFEEIAYETEIEVIRTKQDVKRPPPPVVKPSPEVVPEDIEFNPEPQPEPIVDKVELKDVEPREMTPRPVVKKAVPPPAPLPKAPEPESHPIFFVVEEMPRFKGCEDIDGDRAAKKTCADKKLLQYIYKNIKYPSIARENHIEGTVVIQFIIEKDGSITGIKIPKDIGGGCGREAARVVKGMPDWIPGKQRGNNVRVRYNLPVRYQLE